jgi:hypothetical protein
VCNVLIGADTANNRPPCCNVLIGAETTKVVGRHVCDVLISADITNSRPLLCVCNSRSPYV